MTDAITKVAARALQEKLGSVTFAGRTNLLPLSLNDVADIVLAAVTPLIRAQVLKEAANVAHDHGRYSEAYLDDDLPDDVVIHNHACWDIRDKLRALKEQP